MQFGHEQAYPHAVARHPVLMAASAFLDDAMQPQASKIISHAAG